MNKNKLFGIALFVVAVALIVIMAVPAQAETRYMSGAFRYGAWAPVVRIRHKTYEGVVLQQKADGTVTWCSKAKDIDEQFFVILPAEESGYYYFRTIGRPLDVLTYGKDASGRAMVTMEQPKIPPVYDWEYRTPDDSQKFKIEWVKSGKDAGGKKVTNCYRLRCKKGNAIVTFNGWVYANFEQVNAPE